jgi:hypothetical protein
MESYTIWHDNDYDFAFWIYENSELKNKQDVKIRPIPKNNNPNTLFRIIKNKDDCLILPIIKYESPDVIIQKISENKNKILLVTEFMTHTPQWQHPAQRFTRIYGASNLNIPSALVVAKRMIKYENNNGEYVQKPYSLSPIIPKLYYKTNYVNQTPTLIYFWPTDGFHKIDVKHPTAPKIENDIKEWINFLNACIDEDEEGLEKVVDKHNKKMVRFLNEKGENISSLSEITIDETNYKTLDGPLQVDKNSEFENIPNEDKLKEGFVFRPEGLSPRSSYFRTDPYAGMLSAFDNLFCRDETGKRKFNLILKAKNVTLEKLKEKGTFIETTNHSNQTCPFENFEILKKITFDDVKKHLLKKNCPFTSTKQQRIYAQIPDGIIFDDVYYTGDKH